MAPVRELKIGFFFKKKHTPPFIHFASRRKAWHQTMRAACVLSALCFLAMSSTSYADEVARITRCELCEIVIEEGQKFIQTVMNDPNQMAQGHVRLDQQFERLRSETVRWVDFTEPYRFAISDFYLDQPKHWESIVWKFQHQYGAKTFDADEMRKGSRAGGGVHPGELYTIWKRECHDISEFCDVSKTPDVMFREPSIKANTCGVCRYMMFLAFMITIY